MVGISAVTTNSPAASLRSRRDISARRPSGRDVLVAPGHEVAPRRRAVQAVVGRRPQAGGVRAPYPEAVGGARGPPPEPPPLGAGPPVAGPAGAAPRGRAPGVRAG